MYGKSPLNSSVSTGNQKTQVFPPLSDALTVDAEFFVRQKYYSVEHDIHVTTLTPKDLSPETPCPCDPLNDLPTFRPGDFVLVKERDRLQPYRIEMYKDRRAWIRQMDRRREVEGQGKVNELVWTNVVINVAAKRVVRKCQVVKVKKGEEVPRLADWGGSSDWFFYREGVKVEGLLHVDGEISTETGVDVEEGIAKPGSQLTPIDDGADSVTVTTEPESSFPPASIPRTNPENQTPASAASPNGDWRTIGGLVDAKLTEPTLTRVIEDEVNRVLADLVDSRQEKIPYDRKLRGLDLFCGGGNFGRGVGDGGAVQHKWCVLLKIPLTLGLSILTSMRYTPIKPT